MPAISLQTRAAEFRETFHKRVLVADGAMGTVLHTKGAFVNRCLDELNLSLPALVRDVHQEYLRAGAEVLETNTFGANRKRLATFGFGDKVGLINRAGVRIAREAARDQAFVAGSMGPLGVRLEPLGSTSLEEARSIFLEQAQALVEAGADLLTLETFFDLREVREAVAAARQAAGPEVAIAILLTIQDDGCLQDGTPAGAFTQQLDEMPVDIIGLNCSSGPRAILETIEEMAGYTNKPLAAMPNAGLPVQMAGRNIYLCSPEYMARYARRLLQAGVRMIGGCCGTTPEHIRQMLLEARNVELPERHAAVWVEHPSATAASGTVGEKVPVAEKSGLGAKLAAGRFVTLAEILPPRGADASKEIEGAKLYKAAGIDCVNVPDGPRASGRLSTLVTCQLLQLQAGIEAVMHFSCRDRNIVSIQSELLGAHAAGIRNLICITGDPTHSGAYPDATAVFDVDSIGLCSIVNNLNRGLDLGGNPLGTHTVLLLGVAANLGADSQDEERRRLDAKIKAGAEYIVTQPVFDLDLLEAFVRHVEPYKIPVIAGIWPLTSLRNGEFMVNELRAPVPEHFLERMRRAESEEAARAEGVAIAQEVLEDARSMVAGVQLSAPSGHYRLAIEVASAIGSRD
jgi:homocysteine S-methyltransferase